MKLLLQIIPSSNGHDRSQSVDRIVSGRAPPPNVDCIITMAPKATASRKCWPMAFNMESMSRLLKPACVA